MSDSRLRRLEALFLECVELPSTDHASFLDVHCASDPALRAELEELLRRDAAGAADVPAAAPTRLGVYELAERLGEGGFGEVYAAEQTAPLRRRVAIKILKVGMDSRAILRRFDAERHALALMDHPAIARVFDAGETEAGRPYFVMELVQGEPITTYCDHCGLPLRERLLLFVSVCRAVEHAHRKGIIHRDLKPSNILVTTLDGAPHPKVIDFGIAKATTDAGLTDAPRTLAGELLGTPEYMSPEQAASQGADVDTRTDVYSLGVVLYRLLAGRVPFETTKLRGTPLSTMQRILLEEAPARPSVVSGSRELQGDLDWIVLRALEKDRERRYASAAAFADDVERHLRDEPVDAGPPGTLYRLRKLVRRRRGLVASAAAVLLALTAGVLATAIQAVRATRAEGRAQSEARVATSVNEFLARMLTSGDPQAEARGREITVRELLDRASGELDETPPSFPEVEAGVRHALGSTYAGLGLYGEAETHFTRAISIREGTEGARARATLQSRMELATLYERRGLDATAESLLAGITRDLPRDPGSDPELRARYLWLAGGVASNLGRYPEADSVYTELVALRREAAERMPGAPRFQTMLALSLGEHAEIKKRRGQLQKAEPLAREAYDLARRTYAGDHHDVAMAGARLAAVLVSAGRLQEAEGLYRDALAMAVRVLGPEHPLVAEVMVNHGSTLGLLGRLEEAEETLRRALEILDEQVDPESRRRVDLMSALATVLQDRGKLEEALRLRLAALALIRKLPGEPSPRLASSWNNLGSTYRLMHRYEEAAGAFLEAIPLLRAVHGETHPDVAVALHNLGKTRLDQGRAEEGERLLSEAIALGARAFPENHPARSVMLGAHGRALAALGRTDEAKKELERAREGLAAAFGAGHARTKEVDEALAKLQGSR